MGLNHFLRANGSSAGRLRRMLGRLGPTWAAAPLRRLAQAAALTIFLLLLFYVSWPGSSLDHASARADREVVDAESFLALDPLVSVSAAVASRAWVWSLAWAGVMLAAGLIVPRGFCGYLCPLGTLADLSDVIIGRLRGRKRRGRAAVNGRRSWWSGLRYFILVGVLSAAAVGVMLAGFAAAIPVLVRGLALSVGWVQVGLLRGWDAAPALTVGQAIAVAMLAGVLLMGLIRPRFWCRYVCPSGALLSVGTMVSLTGRKVTSACVSCGKCVEACPFDAIRPDFTTRHSACTFCQTCGGVCPVGAITFSHRWDRTDALEPAAATVANGAGGTDVSRRGFLIGAGAFALGAASTGPLFAALAAGRSEQGAVIRPPGSLPEEGFLKVCVRCGECLRACPTGVLQPMGLAAGVDRMWTPQLATDRSGCDSTCNNCGQVCPTGAIRALDMEEKAAVRMGLAIVDTATCLPHAQRGDCQLCYDSCTAAGHGAIEFLRVGVEMDDEGLPIDDSGYLAPVVVAERCVGCGQCQSRCYGMNVVSRGVLTKAAIRVKAGDGRDDRLRSGSYRAIPRGRETEAAPAPETGESPASSDYLPDFLK